MQFEITDQAAIVFSKELYTAVAGGDPIDAALAASRRAIFSAGHELEWGTPVLYSRSPDSRIFVGAGQVRPLGQGLATTATGSPSPGTGNVTGRAGQTPREESKIAAVFRRYRRFLLGLLTVLLIFLSAWILKNYSRYKAENAFIPGSISQEVPKDGTLAPSASRPPEKSLTNGQTPAGPAAAGGTVGTLDRGKAKPDNPSATRQVALAVGAPSIITTSKVSKDDGPKAVAVEVTVDLSDLQAKIGPLIDTISLPSENCPFTGVGNAVLRISQKRIVNEGTVASLKFSGDAEIWACVSVPSAGLVKTRLGSQPFDVEMSFELTVINPSTIGVIVRKPRISYGGNLSPDVKKALLNSISIISTQVTAWLNRFFTSDLCKAQLSQEIISLGPRILSARFLEDSDHLAAACNIRIR
jgi:hypothetical protein